MDFLEELLFLEDEAAGSFAIKNYDDLEADPEELEAAIEAIDNDENSRIFPNFTPVWSFQIRAKNCKKGISCGDSCISASKTCRKTLTPLLQKKKTPSLKAATKSKTKTSAFKSPDTRENYEKRADEWLLQRGYKNVKEFNPQLYTHDLTHQVFHDWAGVDSPTLANGVFKSIDKKIAALDPQGKGPSPTEESLVVASYIIVNRPDQYKSYKDYEDKLTSYAGSTSEPSQAKKELKKIAKRMWEHPERESYEKLMLNLLEKTNFKDIGKDD